MAGTTNTLQWNPTQATQETDTTYLVDSQRAGGATNPSEFDAKLANKLFYQLSTYVTALGQMLANKNFTNSDANLATLTAVMANILTTADLPGGLQTVTWAASIALNTAGYTGFQVTLGGNTTFTAPPTRPGQFVLLVLVQDGVGGRTVTLGSGFDYSTLYPSPTAGSQSTQLFFANAAGTLDAVGPLMTTSGVDGTPIGAAVPSTGTFTTLSASTQLTAPTVASSDNSTKVATTAWSKFGLSVSLGANGYVKLPTWLGGWIVQWGTVTGVGSGGNNGQAAVSFPTAFTSTPRVLCTPSTSPTGSDSQDGMSCYSVGKSTIGFTVTVTAVVTIGGSGASGVNNVQVDWFAVGN